MTLTPTPPPSPISNSLLIVQCWVWMAPLSILRTCVFISSDCLQIQFCWNITTLCLRLFNNIEVVTLEQKLYSQAILDDMAILFVCSIKMTCKKLWLWWHHIYFYPTVRDRSSEWCYNFIFSYFLRWVNAWDSSHSLSSHCIFYTSTPASVSWYSDN